MISENLKTVLATSFAFYLKAHKFHWNVMGPDFAQHHDYLGDLYEEVHDAIDTIAEAIRTQGVLSPGSLVEFQELSRIDDSLVDISNGAAMLSTLVQDNEVVIQTIKDAYFVAEEEQAFDVSDMLATRLGAHKKHGWMLNAFLGLQQR